MGIFIELPAGVKDGIRIGLQLVLWESLGQLMGSNNAVGRTFTGDCTWAAVTAVLIAAPLIGKMTQTGMQRIVGTIIGGTSFHAEPHKHHASHVLAPD